MFLLLGSVDSDLAKGLAVYVGLIALVTLACAFGARAIMKGKGRSGALGFFLGFFLGLIGLLIAGLLPTTPEYEAFKMRRQMQLLGMPVPAHDQGFIAADIGAKFQRSSTLSPIAASAIVAAVAVAAYLVPDVSWLGIERSEAIVVLAALLVALVAALITRKDLFAAACIGMVLFSSGFGVYWVVRDRGGWNTEQLIAIAADIAVIVAAIMTLKRPSAQLSHLPSWWRQTVLAIGGVGAVAMLLEGESPEDLLSFKGIGLVVAAIAAYRATRSSLALAAGWGLFGTAIVVYSELDVLNTSYRDSNSSIATVVAIAIAGLGGLSAWALRGAASGGTAPAPPIVKSQWAPPASPTSVPPPPPPPASWQ